jgi:acyl-CoA thioesterase FadM
MTHQHQQHDGEGDAEQHEQSNESTPSGDDDEPDSVANIPLNSTIMKATNRQQQEQQQYIAHRLLQWFVTESVVSSRDLDFNWHMSNARYSRHADFARFQVFLQTGFRMALRAVDRQSGLVVSALSQKFRRELRWGQQYQIWVRIVGWDQRHFYLEHIFCTRTTTATTPTAIATSTTASSLPTTTNSRKNDKTVAQPRNHAFSRLGLDRATDRIRQHVILDGTVQAVENVMNRQLQLFQEQEHVVASILTTRLTMTRTKVGNRSITPAQILHQLGVSHILPDIIVPPPDIVEWNTSVETSSNRITKPSMITTTRLQSKL